MTGDGLAANLVAADRVEGVLAVVCELLRLGTVPRYSTRQARESRIAGVTMTMSCVLPHH